METTIGWFSALAGLLFGLVLGSFVGMASWRWPREENWTSRSHCTKCGKPISPTALVPVLSWVFMRGKSGCCGTPISARYPLIELTVALPAAFVGWQAGLGPELFLLTGLVATLVFLSVVDLDTGLIPDGSHLIIFALGLGWLYVHPPEFWWAPLLTLAQTAGVGVLLAGGYSWLRKRDMMGWGDVKLMAAAALWLPAAQVPIYLILASLLGLITGIIWRRIYKSDEFPFAPALSVSLLCTLFIAP